MLGVDFLGKIVLFTHCCLSPVCLCFGAVSGTVAGFGLVGACLGFVVLKKCCVVAFV